MMRLRVLEGMGTVERARLALLMIKQVYIDELFNGRMKRGETPLSLCVWEVDRLISTRCSNVEFRIKDIDA